MLGLLLLPTREIAMPTYEYKCNQCEHTFETIRSYRERETEIDCPKCGLASTRVYSAPAVVFKGTGFYSTGG
jgi:putative FmdB family regulatory protein